MFVSVSSTALRKCPGALWRSGRCRALDERVGTAVRAPRRTPVARMLASNGQRRATDDVEQDAEVDDPREMVRGMSKELEAVIGDVVHLEEYALNRTVTLKDSLAADLKKLRHFQDERQLADKIETDLRRKEEAVFEAMRKVLFCVVELKQQAAALTNELESMREFVVENHERIMLAMEALREKGLMGSRHDVFEGEVQKKLDRFDPEI